MRWVWLVVLVISCAPVAAPVPTEDPRIAEVRRANVALQSERDALVAQVQMLQTEASHPTLSLWNTPTAIVRGQFRPLGLPDTFMVRIAFTATTPVRARIMDLKGFVQYMNTGSVDAITYPATTNLDVSFHDAEGCGAYILVLDAPQDTIISPNITVTYAPADHLTGICSVTH